MKLDSGLATLLSMDGYSHILDSKCWWKIEARLTEASKERPHGIRYNLTFHDNHNQRVFGMDNAHVPKNRRKGYHGRIIEYDHVHNDMKDKGTPYSFTSAEQLISDFFKRVEAIEAEIARQEK